MSNRSLIAATYIVQAIGAAGLILSVLAVIDLWPPDSPYFANFVFGFVIEVMVIALAGWQRGHVRVRDRR